VLTLAAIHSVMDAIHSACALREDAYRIVGTSATLVHGLDSPARDIDLLFRNRADVDRASSALAAYSTSPPLFEVENRQYFATFNVDDVDVEFSTVEWETDSDTYECIGAGPWSHFVPLACGNVKVPVVALELRLLSEISRDREDRYLPILQHLGPRSFDRDLVLRGLADRSLTPDQPAALAALLRSGQ